MSDIVNKHPIGPISQERLAVHKRLAEMTIGEVASWEELERMTSCARSRIYQMVRDSIRALERDLMQHYITRHGLGVERVDHTTVVRETLPKKRARVSGAARSVVRTVRKVDLGQLSPEDRMRAILEQTVGELTIQANSPQSMKRLEAGVENKEKFLSPMSPQEAFKKMQAG